MNPNRDTFTGLIVGAAAAFAVSFLVPSQFFIKSKHGDDVVSQEGENRAVEETMIEAKETTVPTIEAPVEAKEGETVTGGNRDRLDTLDTIPSQINAVFSENDLMDAAMYRPVFKSFETAAYVLRLAREQKGARLQEEDAKHFYDLLDKLEKSTFLRDGFEDTRVLVVEGLSGAGKTTLLHNLESKGDVEALDLPIMRYPAEVLAAEKVFEEMPWVIKSAFGFAKLYIMAWVISNSAMNVVMVENYYHSVFAHCLVSHGYTTDELRADLNGSLFEWPLDLPQPTLILYLSASADIRIGRLTGGGDVDEDKESAQHPTLQAMYSFVKGPTMVALDSEGTADEVCETAFQCLEEYGLPLRPDMSTPKTKGRVSLGVYGAFHEVVPN